ncbi:MAG: PRC-barrel domain-containing protein [Spirochaetota bacterium]|nr:PRC-barrel domain-containing protein [Spirochaetota bacterium]
MLHSLKDLYNYNLIADDGEIGRSKDFIFDDLLWTVRYMVANTGKWLFGKKVLISPISLGKPNLISRHIPVKLTKKLIEGSPELDEDAPVSRQHEINWHKYYSWTYYWQGPYTWGIASLPIALSEKTDTKNKSKEDTGDKHLRSVKEVTGYHILARKDEIGHVEDFIVDDKTWTIRYIVVDTRNWLPGKKVLVSPTWIESVNWAEREVKIYLTKDIVESSPEYNHSIPINREYEWNLHNYYKLPKYWD